MNPSQTGHLDNNVFTYRDFVRHSDTDPLGQMTIPALLHLMQESSLWHIKKIGLSFEDLKERNLSWILMRQQVNVNSLANLGDELKVTTYATSGDRFLTYRDFIVENSVGERIASASTEWILFDVSSKRMVNILQHLKDIPYATQMDPLPRPAKLKFEYDYEDTSRHPAEINWFDIDFHYHLNNVEYIHLYVESMPNEYLRKKRVEDIWIQYKKEAHLGLEVIIKRHKFAEDQYLYQMMDPDETEVLSLARIDWVDRS